MENLSKAKEILRQCEKILLTFRNENRVRPHRDEKFLVSWNSLMISGLARAASVLQQSHYVELAEKTLNFIRTYLLDSNTKRLLRVCYIDEKSNEIEFT